MQKINIDFMTRTKTGGIKERHFLLKLKMYR